MPTQVDPPYCKDYLSPLNLMVMLENMLNYALEYKDKNLDQRYGDGRYFEVLESHKPIIHHIFSNERKELEEDIAFDIEYWEDKNISHDRRVKQSKRTKKRAEKTFWNEESNKNWFTSAKGFLIPKGHKLPRLDVAQKRRLNLQDRWITLTEPGDFTNVEEIVRWLGYSRIYDNQKDCLFTGIKLNSTDVNYDEDVIETSISIPLLDTSNVPKIKIHRSVMEENAWIATREGCDHPYPHVKLNRYKNEELREQICHVTGMTYNRNTKWLAEGKKLALIPIAPMIESELYTWLYANKTPNGLPASEWSTKWLQPRLSIEEI